MTRVQYYVISSSFSDGAYGCNITPMNFAKSLNVLMTSQDVSVNAASQTTTINLPDTFFGFTYTKAVITDVAARLISGSAGGLATFAAALSGTTLFTGKTLPSAISADLCLVNCSTQDAASTTYKTGKPGDPITITSGGIVTSTGIYQFDFIGYYM